MQKKCTSCSQQKSSKEFWKNKSQPDGLDNLCTTCRSESISRYRNRVRSEKKPKEVDKAAQIQKRKERAKFNQIYRNYGLTKEQYLAMLNEQNYCCKICDEPEKLCVDHCHTTGKVRGLLCNSCNRAIGSLKENIKSLTKAIEYLKSSKVE